MKPKSFHPDKPIIVGAPSPNGGPRTDLGKEISSRNATRHGCCSTETLILPTESIEEFKSLRNVWFRTYEPKDDMETHLVHQAATADWFLQRATRHLAEVEARIVAIAPNPFDWTDEHHKTIVRFQRYRTAHLNAVSKHRKAIEDHRKNRTNEVRTEERHTMTKARFKIFQEKNTEPDFDAIFAGMREKAISLNRLKPDSPK